MLIGGPGTGKTHLATALGVQGIEHGRKKVRFFSTVELVNALEQEKTDNRAGQLANRLLRLHLVILDELGYLPFSSSGGALLFQLLSKLYERTSVAPKTYRHVPRPTDDADVRVRFRVLAVVDDFTRECLGLVVDTSLSGLRVGRELDRMAELRGCRPAMVVSDNGTELTSHAILRWQEERPVLRGSGVRQSSNLFRNG